MLKNDKPYDQLLIISCITGQVEVANCNCPAGAGGYCDHTIAALYTYAHYTKLGLTKVPAQLACTELPQAWHKPRGGKNIT